MKKLFNAGAILLFGLLAASVPTEAQTTTVEKLEVAHYRAFCEGVVPKKCLVVMREGSLNFGTVYDEIENFDFVPGFHYTLKVEIERVAAPPKDTSGYKYRLKEITAKKPIGDPDRDIDLYGTKWRLLAINGEAVNLASGAWMVFAGHSSSVYGYGGCNSIRGEFSFTEESLKIGSVVSTTGACLVDWGVEDGFLKELGLADGLEVDQERLVLKRGERSVLEFVPYE